MGSLGWPEIMVILVIALIIFGPRKLPQLGKTLGKAMGEFRRATNDLKNTLEVEVSREEEKLSSGDRRKAEDTYSRPNLKREAETKEDPPAWDKKHEPDEKSSPAPAEPTAGQPESDIPDQASPAEPETVAVEEAAEPDLKVE